MAQFDLSSIYTSDKYTSVLDLLKKLINNIDGVQYVAEDEFTSLSSTVSGHTTSISTLNTNYDALNSTVSGHTTSISTLNTNYDALSSTVSGHTTSISTLNSEYGTLNSTVSAHTTSIDSLNTSVGKNTTDISNLTTTVSNIHTTYYTHNICIIIKSVTYAKGTADINISISMLSTSSANFDNVALSSVFSNMLSGGKCLNCLCFCKNLEGADNDFYTLITFQPENNNRITLMSDPTTSSTITFGIDNATVTDSVTPIV